MWYALTTFMSAQAYYGGNIMGESPTPTHYTRGRPAGLDSSLYSHIPLCILCGFARYYYERNTASLGGNRFHNSSMIC